ncbi:MAG TPA: SAM-dependent methyltransferase [Steroidobacteraceae bacterium]|nr:SAM-dependent methyltransferase [Steroidobacteraceae bacterium]
MSELELAPLSADERAHEARVVATIRAAIEAAGGWLPFSRYMELALYAPGLGYYAAGAHKLGAGGDYVTAPELTPVFGRCVATQCAEVLERLGGGEIVELGAGSGALAADLLAELALRGALPAAYRILEPSPELRERQARRLGDLPGDIRRRVAWLEGVPTASFQGIVLANEVLDALPVERFRVGAAGFEALGVAVEGERFAWRAAPATAALAADLSSLTADLATPLPAGFVSEACVSMDPWLAAVTEPLRSGIALLIDYGLPRGAYYAPERDGGTLACHHRQRRHDDVFINVGLQDLSASVDFTRVATAGLAHGLRVAGYTTQAHFLLGTGFARHLAAVRAATEPSRESLCARTAARLVLPSAMGETFKCIALARSYDQPLSGFSLRDFTASL